MNLIIKLIVSHASLFHFSDSSVRVLPIINPLANTEYIKHDYNHLSPTSYFFPPNIKWNTSSQPWRLLFTLWCLLQILLHIGSCFLDPRRKWRSKSQSQVYPEGLQAKVLLGNSHLRSAPLHGHQERLGCQPHSLIPTQALAVRTLSIQFIYVLILIKCMQTPAQA